MGLNTLTDRSDGQIILDTFFNDIHTALKGQFIGRNSSGIPESGQNLGTNSIPWGSVFADTLILAGNAVDTSQITAPLNRLISGAVRSGTSRADFLNPNGAAASFTLEGATTSLLIDINGVTVEYLSDIVVSGLTVAPSTNNTTLVNDIDAADQESTRTWGEKGAEKESITVDTMGTEITGLVGSFQSFKINDGANDEYFYAFIESITELKNIHRGYYVDSSKAPVNRIKFADGDTITLLKTGWVFAEDNSSTIDITYNQPSVQFTAPTSPVTGDYWYDLDNQAWRRYSGTQFDIINRVLVGQVIVDDTNCIGARCIDYYASFSAENDLTLFAETSEIVSTEINGASVSINGQVIRSLSDSLRWNITTNLAGTADMYNPAEQASTFYYLYLDDEGKTIISDISPYAPEEKQGFYHPHNTWRCVGELFNDISSDIKAAQADGYNPRAFTDNSIKVSGGNGQGAVDSNIRRFTSVAFDNGIDISYTDTANEGGVFVINRAGEYALTRSDSSSGAGSYLALTLNSQNLTTSPNVIPVSEMLIEAITLGANAGFPIAFGVTRRFKKGDIIRAHDDPGTSATAVNIVAFTIQKIRN